MFDKTGLLIKASANDLRLIEKEINRKMDEEGFRINSGQRPPTIMGVIMNVDAQTLNPLLHGLRFEKTDNAFPLRIQRPDKPQVDEFPYGWRYQKETLPSGEEILIQIPLTAEDFLNPQLGDVMPQNRRHYQDNVDLYDIFQVRYSKDETVGVFGDMKMLWRIPDLKEPAPDVAIVPNIRNKTAERSSFDVVEEDTRPCLVIEIISPNYPGDDTHKVLIYEKARIAEYIIIDPHSKAKKPYYELSGYRLKGKKYRPIKPNKQGSLLSETTQVLFSTGNEKQELILTDASTGKQLLNNLKREKALQKAEERAQDEGEARREAEARAQALEKQLRELGSMPLN